MDGWLFGVAFVGFFGWMFYLFNKARDRQRIDERQERLNTHRNTQEDDIADTLRTLPGPYYRTSQRDIDFTTKGLFWLMLYRDRVDKATLKASLQNLSPTAAETQIEKVAAELWQRHVRKRRPADGHDNDS